MKDKRPDATDDAWIDAAEASRTLGVERATLYAYVSRGYVRSEPAPGGPRTRRYARRDVERLRQRTERRTCGRTPRTATGLDMEITR